MPYIPPEDREALELGANATSAGELNYKITRLCHDYLAYFGTSYNRLNDIVGVLECAKLEFYQRRVRPYEDIKIAQNGDV